MSAPQQDFTLADRREMMSRKAWQDSPLQGPKKSSFLDAHAFVSRLHKHTVGASQGLNHTRFVTSKAVLHRRERGCPLPAVEQAVFRRMTRSVLAELNAKKVVAPKWSPRRRSGPPSLSPLRRQPQMSELLSEILIPAPISIPTTPLQTTPMASPAQQGTSPIGARHGVCSKSLLELLEDAAHPPSEAATPTPSKGQKKSPSPLEEAELSSLTIATQKSNKELDELFRMV
eukprot:PhM_4_TR14532/c0_g1_i1/m.3039